MHILPALLKVQHQGHLLPEASLIPQLGKTSFAPHTSQPPVRIMGIYVHILPTSPTKPPYFWKAESAVHICLPCAPKRAWYTLSAKYISAQSECWVHKCMSGQTVVGRTGSMDKSMNRQRGQGLKKGEEQRKRRKNGERKEEKTGGRRME